MVADANLNGVSDVHKRAAGTVPVINATTQILQASGKVIVIAIAGGQAPREDTARADTAKTTVGVASGRIGAGVIPAMVVMIVVAPTGARAAPTGQTGKIIGEGVATIVMTAGYLTEPGSVQGAPPIAGGSKMRQAHAGDLTGMVGALIAITAAITAGMNAGMNAGSGKRKRLAQESILSGFAIPVTAPKNGVTIMNPRFLRQSKLLTWIENLGQPYLR